MRYILSEREDAVARSLEEVVALLGKPPSSRELHLIADKKTTKQPPGLSILFADRSVNHKDRSSKSSSAIADRVVSSTSPKPPAVVIVSDNASYLELR